jgi:hypothetical protein
MEKNAVKLYGNKVFGEEVSEYGLKNGYLDYRTLAKIVGDCILNNNVREHTLEDWEMVNGEFTEMVFQDYIITEAGYDLLSELTDEYVFYNEKLDMYIWAVTHYGTSWDYVLTDVKLK